MLRAILRHWLLDTYLDTDGHDKEEPALWH